MSKKIKHSKWVISGMRTLAAIGLLMLLDLLRISINLISSHEWPRFILLPWAMLLCWMIMGEHGDTTFEGDLAKEERSTQ